MNEIEKKLTDIGCPKINLFISKSNIEVKKFYQSMNYENQDILTYGKRLISDE